MRDHGSEACSGGHFDCGQGFGQAADLVRIDEDRIAACPVIACAAAFAAANETARIAFAPSRALSGVPSSAIRAARISPFTWLTARVTPLPP
jgi:hypothetical protein